MTMRIPLLVKSPNTWFGNLCRTNFIGPIAFGTVILVPPLIIALTLKAFLGMAAGILGAVLCLSWSVWWSGRGYNMWSQLFIFFGPKVPYGIYAAVAVLMFVISSVSEEREQRERMQSIIKSHESAIQAGVAALPNQNRKSCVPGFPVKVYADMFIAPNDSTYSGQTVDVCYRSVRDAAQFGFRVSWAAPPP